MFVLARHAHAGDRKEWPYSDRDRPLSRRGWRQSFALAARLGDLPVVRLVSSPYRRCQQTLEPLAELLDLPVLRHPLLQPEAGAPALDELLADGSLDGAVLCTHGETLLALLRHWHDGGVVHLPADRLPRVLGADRGATEKGAAWIVQTRDGIHTATYLATAEDGRRTAR